MHFQTRDLAKSKALRESITKYGFTRITQKRVIIAPPMEGSQAKDVSLRTLDTAFPREDSPSGLYFQKRDIAHYSHGNYPDKEGKLIDLHTLNKEYLDYKSWLERRKEIRRDLDQMQDLQTWLARKEDLSELESRVFVRFLPPIESVSSIQEEPEETVVEEATPSPIPLAKGQARLLPLLQQPLPVALATIDLYLQSKKLRLLDLFTQIDKDKDWSLTRDEIRQIVVETGIPFSIAQIDELIIALDVDNNEQLNYKELAIGLEAYKVDTRWQKIKQILRMAKEEHEIEIQKPTFETIPVRGRRTSWLHGSSEGLFPSPSLQTTSSPYSSSSVDSSSLSSLTSSTNLLQVPSLNMTEKVEDTAAKAKEKRLRKQQQKKEKRAKQKKKVEKASLPPSTMSDSVGQVKDRYLASQYEQMNTSLDVSHTKGVPLKKELFERVFIIPPDKAREKIRKKIRQPGLHLMSSLDLQLGDQNKDGNNDDESKSNGHRNAKHGKSSSKSQKDRMVDVFWPQSLLDKLRICDDKPRARDKTHSIFYTVK